jgi:hypothetical protein
MFVDILKVTAKKSRIRIRYLLHGPKDTDPDVCKNVADPERCGVLLLKGMCHEMNIFFEGL